jgi:transcription initiation factor TFIID TATA-box-binding protein
VRNLVVSADAGGGVPLDQVRLAFPEEEIEYEPETFPGLVMQLASPRVTLLVFRSGRIVATGSGDMPEVEEALEGFVGALRERRLIEAQDEEEARPAGGA